MKAFSPKAVGREGRDRWDLIQVAFGSLHIYIFFVPAFVLIMHVPLGLLDGMFLVSHVSLSAQRVRSCADPRGYRNQLTTSIDIDTVGHDVCNLYIAHETLPPHYTPG